MQIDERQRDYSLFFQTPLGANKQLPAQQLRVDTDGPFCLREIGFMGLGGEQPQSIAVKFQDELGRFRQQDFTASFAELPYQGSVPSNYTGDLPIFTPIIPQIIYPPNSTIVVYLENTNPTQSISQAQIVFRGTSLHPRGTILNGFGYPKYFREFPFAYVNEVVQATTFQPNNILNILSDADFALRAAELVQITQANAEMAGEGAGTILFSATPFGYKGNGIIIVINSPSPTPNQAFSLTVNLVTKTITINCATNGAGSNSTLASQIVAAINASSSASSLVTAQLIGPDGGIIVETLTTASGGQILSILNSNWLIQFKDQNGKYYQTGSNSDVITAAGIFPDSILGHLTPYIPGIFAPEIYLTRNSALYFDVLTPSAPLNYYVRFIGSKIFESQTPC
jgi:hypothetical protein